MAIARDAVERVTNGIESNSTGQRQLRRKCEEQRVPVERVVVSRSLKIVAQLLLRRLKVRAPRIRAQIRQGILVARLDDVLH